MTRVRVSKVPRQSGILFDSDSKKSWQYYYIYFILMSDSDFDESDSKNHTLVYYSSIN